MRPTLPVSHIHRPLIHFIGKRTWPAIPEPPHAHPAAPPEYKAHFADFVKKFQSSVSSPSSSSSSSSSSASSASSVAQKATSTPSSGKSNANANDAHQYFWQAPPRLWNPRVRRMTPEEIEAILSGGASLH